MERLMATEDEMNRLSRHVQHAAMTLFHAIINAQPRADDEDIHAAAINGLNGAVAQLMWNRRDEQATPDTIADAIRLAAHDLLCQMQRRERN
jgi:hypothetical protein